MPSKLHLKRTPAEQAAHDLRKARKAARRAKKHSHSPSRHHSSHHKSSSHSKYHNTPLHDEDEDSDAYGPPPPSSKPRAGPSSFDYGYEFDFDETDTYDDGTQRPTAMDIDEDEIRARVEEERFREKMFGALEDDERLDTVEARMNDYAHVPRRWRTDTGASTKTSRSEWGGLDGSAWEKADPTMMDDEEYAEWIRAGMWRKKNAATIEAQAQAAARQQALKAEADRQAREAEAIRERKRRERRHRRDQDARNEYERRWTELLLPPSSSSAPSSVDAAGADLLGFTDIPWPIFHGRLLDVEDLNSESISSFLFPVTFEDEEEAAKVSKKKEKLRETMLRFHPDKFEGRIMRRVKEEEKEKVKEGVSAVVRATSALMQSSTGG